MKHNIFVLLSFLGFWMVLSERLTIESVVLGLLVALLIYFIMHREVKPLSVETMFLSIRNISKYGTYLCLLVKEIVISNIQVAKVVLSPRISISPTIITYETKLRSQFHKAVLANSITLTPGTLTVLLENNTLTIHCLRKEYAESIVNSKLEKILIEIEE